MSSVYCRGGNKLVFDVADHYVQNGNTHIFTMFFNHPQLNQTGNLRSQKKKCVTHQNKNSAQNKNHNQHQCQKMQL